MNYEKIYYSLVETCKKKNRSKNDGVYYESHHILPRCLGGTNNPDNLVLLTAKEHLFAHLLLPEFHTGAAQWKMKFALTHMESCGKRQQRKITTGQAAYFRELKSELMKGRKVSVETKQKLREINLGRKNSVQKQTQINKKLKEAYAKKPHTNKGKPMEWYQKTLSSRLKTFKTPEYKKEHSQRSKKMWETPGHKDKMKKAHAAGRYLIYKDEIFLKETITFKDAATFLGILPESARLLARKGHVGKQGNAKGVKINFIPFT